jgi:hypothetical protein
MSSSTATPTPTPTPTPPNVLLPESATRQAPAPTSASAPAPAPAPDDEDALSLSSGLGGGGSTHSGFSGSQRSVGGGGGHTTGSGDADEYGTDAIAKRESKAISCAKLVVLGFLLSLAVVVSYVWYTFSETAEQDTYTNEFHESSTKLLETFYQRVADKLVTSDSLATALSLSVMGATQQTNQQQQQQAWPRVSFSNWERRTAGIRRVTQASSIWFAPLVTRDDREAWEAYALDHQHEVLQPPNFTDPFTPQYSHSRSITEAASPYYQPLVADWTVKDGIYDLNQGIPLRSGESSSSNQDKEDYYWAPIWQAAPYALTHDMALFNQRSERARQVALENLVTYQAPFLASTYHTGVTDSLVILEGGSSSSSSSSSSSLLYAVKPHVALYTPIFLNPRTTDDDNNDGTVVVGALTLEMSWESFWSDAVSGIVAPLLVILENNCHESYLFQVDSYSSTFLGVEQDDDDMAIFENALNLVMESDALELAQLFGWKEPAIRNALMAEEEGNMESMSTICNYRIKILPTREFEDEFLTNTPIVFSLGVGGIFLLVALVFMFYDWLVERRQKSVMLSHKRSSAIVRYVVFCCCMEQMFGPNRVCGSLEFLSYFRLLFPFLVCCINVVERQKITKIASFIGRCFRLVCGIALLMMAKVEGMVALPTCYPKITCPWKLPNSASRITSQTFHSSLKGMAIIHHPCWGPNRLPISSPIPASCLQILLVLRHGRPPESPLKFLLFWKPCMGPWTRQHGNWVCSR